MQADRRTALLGALTTAALSVPTVSRAASLAKPFAPLAGARSRVVFVNDLSGDVDGLFAAVHQILSPSADLRGIVGTSNGRGGGEAANTGGSPPPPLHSTPHTPR